MLEPIHSLYTEQQTQKKERKYEQSLIKKKVQSPLRAMVLLALVLISAILITSCSQVRVNQKYESCNLLGEDCVYHQIRIPF